MASVVERSSVIGVVRLAARILQKKTRRAATNDEDGFRPRMSVGQARQVDGSALSLV